MIRVNKDGIPYDSDLTEVEVSRSEDEGVQELILLVRSLTRKIERASNASMCPDCAMYVQHALQR
jgi:hypothetical protein